MKMSISLVSCLLAGISFAMREPAELPLKISERILPENAFVCICNEDFDDNGSALLRLADELGTNSTFNVITLSLRCRHDLKAGETRDLAKRFIDRSHQYGMKVLVDADPRIARDEFLRRWPEDVTQVVVFGGGKPNLGDHMTGGTRGYEIRGESVFDEVSGAKIYDLYNCDIWSDHIFEYAEELASDYKALGADAAMRDEWGLPPTSDGNFAQHKVFWYSKRMAEAFERRFGYPLKDAILKMSVAKGPEPAVTQYEQLIFHRNAQIERHHYELTKRLWGPDAYVTKHPTWFPAIDRFDFQRNGLHWWAAKRDWAQTDEIVPLPAQLGLAKTFGGPCWMNEGYQDAPEKYAPMVWRYLLSGGRMVYHHVYGGTWSKDLPYAERRVKGLMSVVEGPCGVAQKRARLVSMISKAQLDSPVALVFDHWGVMDWTGSVYRNWGEGIAYGLYDRGWAVDAFPHTAVTDADGRWSVKDGYLCCGSQRYEVLVRMNPSIELGLNGLDIKKATRTAVFDGNAPGVVERISSELERRGAIRQPPTVDEFSFWHFAKSRLVGTEGTATLQDGTKIVVKGAGPNPAGDPIEGVLEFPNGKIEYSATGVFAARLKEDGSLAAYCGGGLKHVRCGDYERFFDGRKDLYWMEEEMTIGEKICGFTVTAVESLPEVSGRMVRLTYEKNGAELVWLDRADDNKTFGIAFKTPPVDDTGVTHILEHSVLCGSDRYPVKEPFVELLKSSMATYLNASTWPDRTVYPVATRNDRDFLNLVSVYLDAVFHPLCVKNDWAWRQEGWHYEFKGDQLVRNGVVYSEMKGALASARSLGGKALDRAMFPDNAYRFVSGGDPDHIPELTFEKYRAYYEAHYHPSNAKIFLDGRVDLRPILAVLDTCLAGFERRAVDFSVPLQQPVVSRQTMKYPATDENGKVFLFDGWGVGTYRDRKRLLALQVLCDYLVGSNESPVKKALLDRQLCTDVSLYPSAMEQATVELIVENTTVEHAETCRQVFRETIDALLKGGLDRPSLSAKLDNAEFQDREKDFGSYARGLAFMNDALGLWIYGGDPAEAFRSADLFADLREDLEKGGFEQVLREAFVDNPHHAEVTLEPSATLAAEKRVADEAELARTLAEMTEDEVVELKRQADDLKRRQAAVDAPEDLAKLPRLSLTDIPVQGSYTPMTASERKGTTVLRSNVGVDGIVYLNLAFPLDGLSDEELLAVPVLADMLGYVPTTDHATLALRNEIDSRLGRLNFAASSTSRGPYLKVALSALTSRKDDAQRLLSEVLLRSRFDDAKVVADHVAQARESNEQAFQRRGDILAMLHAGGFVSRQDEISDMFDGLRQLRWLQSGVSCDFAALARRIFTRRVIVSVTDNVEESFVDTLLAGLPEAPAEAVARQDFQAPVSSERPRVGLEIAAPVGFSGYVGRLPSAASYSGAYAVAARIASLDHLWNEVRVKGGAYGAYLRVNHTGRVSFGSYRDPNPAGALGSFRATGRALESFVKSGHSFEKYQVAVIGQMEPYRSPRAEAAYVLDSHLEGLTLERRQKTREEVLRTTPEDLLGCARALAETAEKAVHCVVGGKDVLGKCALDRVEPVVQQP